MWSSHIFDHLHNPVNPLQNITVLANQEGPPVPKLYNLIIQFQLLPDFEISQTNGFAERVFAAKHLRFVVCPLNITYDVVKLRLEIYLLQQVVENDAQILQLLQVLQVDQLVRWLEVVWDQLQFFNVCKFLEEAHESEVPVQRESLQVNQVTDPLELGVVLVYS